MVNSPFAGPSIWNKWLPIKVNCFLWRLLLNRLPTKSILASKGIPVPSTACSLCSLEEETIEHLFYECSAAKEIWNWLSNWCGVNLGNHNSLVSLIYNCLDVAKSRSQRLFLEAAMGCLLWCFWKSRNKSAFNGVPFSVSMVSSEIQALLFTWMKFRANFRLLMWPMWCCNPLVAISM